MNLQNGYKVIYEKAADGKRTFYASKSAIYPNDDDLVVASFNDADYKGKVIYEYKGNFYVSTGSIPAYDKDGVPTDNKIEGFDKLFVEDKSQDPVETPVETPAQLVEPEEPVETPNLDAGNGEDGPTYDLPAFDEEDEE